MKKIIKTALQCLAFMLVVAAVGCSAPKEFKIEGEIEGAPTMNLYVKYFSGDAVQRGVTPAENGKFSFVAPAPTPAIVVILDNEGKVLGRAFAKNGDKIKMTLSRNNPCKISLSGTPENEAWALALNQLADSIMGASPAKVNGIVERYSAEHGGGIVSALLFATLYDYSVNPMRADSVINSISSASPEALPLLAPVNTLLIRYLDSAFVRPVDTIRYRPIEQDTALVFTPKAKASLLVFTSDRYDRLDSLIYHLKDLKKKKSELDVLDIMLTADSNTWKRNVRLDSATWQQGWIPGGLYGADIDKLGLPRTPFFIVIDKEGKQFLRTDTLRNARAAIDSLLAR